MRRPYSYSACYALPWKTLVLWMVISALTAGLTAGSALAQQSNIDFGVIHERVPVAVSSGARQSVAVKNLLGSESISVDPKDEIWIVSAHQVCKLGCLKARCNKQTSPIEFETKRLACNQWQTQELSDLAYCHQSDLGHVTIMLVHGNNTNEDWALTRGMQFYDRIFGQCPDGRVPVRLVILAWESEKVLPRPCPDYKLKSARAVALGASMAALLNDLGGDRPVLVGYSLGAQVVLSTLTEMAASENVESCKSRPQFHVAVIAPALEAGFACGDLAKIGCNPLIDDAQIFVNRRDRVVKSAQVLNRKRCEDRSAEPSLIGMADMGQLDSNRFRLHDVTREVRNRHSLINYIQSTKLRQQIRRVIANAAAEHLSPLVEVNGEQAAEEIASSELSPSSGSATDGPATPVQR